MTTWRKTFMTTWSKFVEDPNRTTAGRARWASRLRLGLGIVAALSLAPTLLAQDVTFTKVVDETTAVPGEPGQLFADAGGDDCRAFGPAVEAPAFSDGRVLFHAFHQPGPGRGLYLWEGGALTKVVDDLTEPPGSDSQFSDLDETPTLQGLSAGFRATPTGEPTAIYLWQGGTLTEVAAEGDPSFSTAGASIQSLASSPAAAGASLAFISQDDSAEQVEGVYLWDGSTVVTLADESTEAPGQPGKLFTNFEAVATELDGGRVVFWGETTTDLGGGSFTTNEGLYLADGTSLARIADESTPVPGAPSETFADFEAFAPSFDGDTVYFHASYEVDVSGGTNLISGIYVWSGGTLSTVVTEGSSVAGGGTVGDIGNFSGADGRVVFESDCTVLYLVVDGEVRGVTGSGDSIDGRLVEEVWLGRQALDGLGFAFNVRFEDGDDQDAVYLAALPGPASLEEVPTLGQWGLALLALLLAVSALRVVRRRPAAERDLG